jgi:glutamate carboxypeptidase
MANKLNSSVDFHRVRGSADKLAHEVATRLQEMIEIESPSRSVASLNVLRDNLVGRWTSLGLDVEVVQGAEGDHLVATLRPPESFNESGRSVGHVCFITHYDTVWPVGELARQPFVIADDRAFGPGCFDMKGGIVAFETAVQLMQELDITAAQEIRLICIADEEVSSVDGRRIVLEHAKGASAVLGLEPCHPDGSFKNGRRGVARVALKVTGREAHSGLDATLGVSATDELVDQLMALRRTLPEAKDVGCNIGLLNGGSRANVIAGAAQAEIGLRFGTKETEEALFRSLNALTPIREGATVELEVLAHRPAWEADTESSLTRHVINMSEALGEPASARPASGAGDTNLTGSAQIPTLDGLGPRGAGAHAQGECVELNSLRRRAELIVALIATPIPRAT